MGPKDEFCCAALGSSACILPLGHEGFHSSDPKIRIYSCKTCGKRRIAEHVDPERVCHVCRFKEQDG